MKFKSLLALGMVASLSVCSFGSVRTPKDPSGQSLATIDWVGSLPCAITAATGTAAVLCGTAQRGEVFGVIISSTPNLTQGIYVVLRDSNTANTTSSSFTEVGVQPNGTTQVLPGSTIVQTFPRPIQYTNGLSANMTATPQNNEVWTILYRPLAATE